MAIGDDFTIDYTNKRVYHSAGATTYSVNALYSYLQDTFDELGQMDDDVPMSAQTPTEYTLVNNWFMDYPSFEYLTGGAVQTDGWEASDDNEGIRILTFDAGGYVSCVVGDTGSAVTGETTSDSATLLAFDNTLRKWWVRVDASGDEFDQAEVVGVPGGDGSGTTSAASVAGENLWANVYTLGTLEDDTNIYVIQSGDHVAAWWPADQIDILLNVKEADTEIDGAEVTVFARQYTKLYDHFPIDLSAGGRNAVPVATFEDLNNTTASGTVAGYSSIGLTFGITAQNLNNGNGLRPYHLIVDCDESGLAGVYEYLKYITRSGSIYMCDTTTGEQYISLSGSFAPVKAAPFGTFAGGTFFGARGVWLTNYDATDAKNFQLIDTSGTTQTPPNVVTISVTSVVGGDRVAVFKLDSVGGIIDKSEYDAQTGNDSGDTALWVKGTISGDTPSAGWVRIGSDRYEYDAWETGQFNVPSGLTSAYAEDADIYVPIVDKQATATTAQNTLIYANDIPVLIRVRKKGIIPFEVESTVTNVGLSVAAIRTIDSIVT